MERNYQLNYHGPITYVTENLYPLHAEANAVWLTVVVEIDSAVE